MENKVRKYISNFHYTTILSKNILLAYILVCYKNAYIHSYAKIQTLQNCCGRATYYFKCTLL